MIKLYDTGAYLVNGTELVEDSGDAKLILRNMLGKDTLSREEAAENTIAYRILKNHNTSGNMEKLKIKFDKLTSHDITYVGIIQTARASGLEKFPIPYVLTNCHNSLCAVGALPMLWATGAGAINQQYLGTAVFGGMVATALLTVLYAPFFYAVFMGLSSKLGGKRTPEPKQA